MNNIMNTIIRKNDPIVIAVDHGFGNIKTAHCCFRTGVTAYDKKPIFTNEMLVYDGKYYIIGEEHKEFVPDTYAGIQLRNACAEIMQRQGYEEPTGQAKITSGYNLPCKYVLHMALQPEIREGKTLHNATCQRGGRQGRLRPGDDQAAGHQAGGAGGLQTDSE